MQPPAEGSEFRARHHAGAPKIVERETGEIFRGRVPAYSVVVPAASPLAGQPVSSGVAVAVCTPT